MKGAWEEAASRARSPGEKPTGSARWSGVRGAGGGGRRTTGRGRSAQKGGGQRRDLLLQASGARKVETQVSTGAAARWAGPSWKTP